MTYQRGDLIFSRNGQPGMVMDRKPVDQSLIVQQHGEDYEKSRKYGYVNGLSPAERQDYQVAIDEARKESSPNLRVESLRKKITDLQFDPSRQVLKRYLEAEMAHIINSENIRVDQYEVDEGKIF
ncbi:MAG: hypothetical protein ACOH5I_02245 [Oligoflexus sp.]